MIESLENESIKKGNDFSKIVVDQLNQTLANPSEDFDKEINRVIKRLIKISTRKLDNTPESQKLFFDETCNFLNSVFGSVHIKKFYNTAPIKSFREYADMSLGKEAINNIYGKERKLFYKEQIGGGSCHHRTIFLKKLFDKLEKKGLDIKSRIILFSDVGGHSMVVIEFQGIKYYADVFGDNDYTDIIRKVSKNDLIFDEKNLYRRDQIEYFSEIEQFAEHMEEKPFEEIKIIFKPKLDGECSNEININIDSDAILVSTGGKSYRSFFKKIIIPKKLHNNELIDYLIQNSIGDKKDKQEISKYLEIVRKKINPEKLRKLFKSK